MRPVWPGGHGGQPSYTRRRGGAPTCVPEDGGVAATRPAGRASVRRAAIASLDELAFAPVTVFVGENGTGKSTLIEALAVACGFNAEGGGRNLTFETHATHSTLHEHLALRFRRRPQHGWFLRAETFYGMATRVVTDDGQFGVARYFPDLHGRSHGQSFLELMEQRFVGAGLYLMDEPESALSFLGQLRLMGLMVDALATDRSS